MINRIIAKDIARSSKSILLLGPRQTGKSTLIKSLKSDLMINYSLGPLVLRELGYILKKEDLIFGFLP